MFSRSASVNGSVPSRGNADDRSLSARSSASSSSTETEYSDSEDRSSIRSACRFSRQTYLESDVICARGRFAINHPGNQRFRVLCDSWLDQYQSLAKTAKRSFAADAVKVMSDQEPPARFRKRSSAGDWYTLSPEKAIKKVQHALTDFSAAIKAGKAQRSADPQTPTPSINIDWGSATKSSGASRRFSRDDSASFSSDRSSAMRSETESEVPLAHATVVTSGYEPLDEFHEAYREFQSNHSEETDSLVCYRAFLRSYQAQLQYDDANSEETDTDISRG